MSGHSKWANIRRRKESVDSKKAKIYSKLGKEITVAVRLGGSGDVGLNARLRDTVSKARASNMPSDNINRCITKALGSDSGANFEEITYEGFGPYKVAVIVEAMTDNKNRAAADIRCIFDRSEGSMGQTGTVTYMFSKLGVIVIENDGEINEDELMLYALENQADDIVFEEEYAEITCSPENFSKLRIALEEKKYNIVDAEIKMVANIKKEITEEQEEKFQVFLDKLEDNDDVQSVWHNADI